MKLPSFFSFVQKNYEQLQQERQIMFGRSNQMLRQAKQAIFALHRQGFSEAEQHLQEANTIFVHLQKQLHKFPLLACEGSYRAALEEYAEAILFFQFLCWGTWKKLETSLLEPSIFLGGLSDATGEMVRYAVRQATQGNKKEVEKIYGTIERVVEYLLQMDLTGSLRQKNDQAKRNLQSLERILYDMRSV